MGGELERGKDSVARPLGATELKSLQSSPTSPGNGLAPCSYHIYWGREGALSGCGDQPPPSRRSESTCSHSQRCQKNLRICLILVEVLRIELDQYRASSSISKVQLLGYLSLPVFPCSSLHQGPSPYFYSFLSSSFSLSF